MELNKEILSIMDRAMEGRAPSKSDCLALLSCEPLSGEATLIRGVADALTRSRFGNTGIVQGQIGIEIDKCPGQCKFCSFGEQHTAFQRNTMPIEDVLASAQAFTETGDLFALFLLGMHHVDFDHLLKTVAGIRASIQECPQIVVNIGDFDGSQADELRDAGVNGAYHVCRLREGTDTALDPEERKRTITAIREAGLDWYNCCEPVGPEHTPQELADQIFLGVEYGCFQHAAMRRVYVPNTPLAQYGQITELRLAQITAVVALASLGSPETKSIAVHEPNLIGLTSGANVVYAETGANPRDTKADTAGHRGKDVQACKTMLYEAGFEYIEGASGNQRSITDVFSL